MNAALLPRAGLRAVMFRPRPGTSASQVAVPDAGECCWRCRTSLRLYSSDASSGVAGSALPLPPPPPASGVARLGSRRLISVAGPDAAKYLQGVITSNMQPSRRSAAAEAAAAAEGTTETRHGFYSGFLNAQGRVLHDVFVYRDVLLGGAQRGKGGVDDGDDPAFLVEVDADEARTLERHIRRYKLRAKFDVRLLDADELAVWHAWGEGAGEGAALGGGSGGSGSSGGSAPVIAVCDSRAPGLGWRYVAALGSATGSASGPAPALLPLDVVDESAYRIRRYLLGVAEGQREILRGQALPLESNMDFMGGIDFHKGCYVGQELTIRTRHRGVVRKRILPCIVYPEEAGAGVPDELAYVPGSHPGIDLAGSVPPETSIGRVGKKGRSAGKWLAGIGNVGLALCRLEPMTDVVLPEEAAATAAAATSSAPGEFAMAWTGAEGTGDGDGEGAVRIKAFVPDWLRQGLVPKSS